MNPFLYPKARHRRHQSPPSFSDYRRYKPYLQAEFERQCVYCRLPDTMGHDFGVDHYRPASRFPEFTCDYANLYYACNACNRRKGAYWPTRHQDRAGCFVPNPCDHVMFEHLRYVRAQVQARSSTGGFTIDLLDLNDDDSVLFRELVIDAIAGFEGERAKLLRLIERLGKLHAARRDRPAIATRLAARLSEAESRLTTVEQHLARLSGQLGVGALTCPGSVENRKDGVLSQGMFRIGRRRKGRKQ